MMKKWNYERIHKFCFVSTLITTKLSGQRKFALLVKRDCDIEAAYEKADKVDSIWLHFFTTAIPLCDQ